MKRPFGLVCFFIIFVCTLSRPSAAEEDTLTLLYGDLAPYVTSSPQGTTGFLKDHLEGAAQKAGISLKWQYIPWSQQVLLLQRMPVNVCGVGLFDTPERRRYLVFTDAIGRDYGMAVAARKDDTLVASHTSLSGLLMDSRLTGVVQQHTHYGPYVDPLLKGRDLIVAEGSTLRTLRDLAAGRGDFMLATKPTFEVLIKRHGLSDKLIVRDDLTDMQDDVLFFMGCTKSSDRDMLARLNAVLHTMEPVCPDGPCRH